MSNTDKILRIKAVAEKISRFKEQGKKTVLCHGVFDLLHLGHIRYFEQAKAFGDILIVTLTADQYVDKGPHRPAFTEKHRAEAIASLNCVDFVSVNHWETAEDTLRLLQPDFYVKGAEFKNITSDRTGKIVKERHVAEELGIELKFTEDIVFSSSHLINRYFSIFPDEINSYLSLLRQRYSLKEILHTLDKTSDLRVLVIGDTILDEYQYGNAIGKSSKDPTLVLKYQTHDLFAGGVLAVANHVANFATSVDVITLIGDQNSNESFIRQQLQPNVYPHLIVKKQSPTTIKRRFIDGYSLNKLLEVYVMNDDEMPPEIEKHTCNTIERLASKCDLVIAADFGHGAINNKIRETLIRTAPFLAVNTQANAGNRGFHTISSYSQTDYSCIAEHELHLEKRHRTNNLRISMEELRQQQSAQYFTTTLGRKGCAICSKANIHVKIPSFATNVVDRVGAGDAFFAITSMLAAQHAPAELIAFIGNIVGALAVKVIGNKTSITREHTEKFITSVLK